ncbi:MAG: tetratricopeptide repeat protein [Bacteroidetes bacterium]|nr:tetratricopeptide repeat protein [Bacteroidota bacterium]
MRKIFILLLLIFVLPVLGKAQTVIKMKSEGGVSIIPCKVNGLNLNFIFDTGASEVSISLTEATFMLKNGYLDTSDIIGTSKYLDANGDISEGVVINLKEIEIAGLKLSNVRATIIKNIKAPLLLGQSAISKLGNIQIDLKSNTLTILNGKVAYDYSKYSQSKTQTADTSSSLNHNPKTEDDYIEEIKAKISEDDYDGIISNCYKILEINPNNEEAYFYRAYAKDGLQDYQGAIEDYSKAIEFNTSYAKAYCFRGISKAKLNNHRDALIDFSKSISIDPKYDFAYEQRGKSKVELKNYREAISDYNKAIQLDPKAQEYYFDRGYAKGELKDYSGALSDYNKAIQLGADDYVTYLNRGNTKTELKNYNGALADYNKSIQLNSESATTYYARGLLKEKLKDYEGAIKDYDKTLEIDSTFYMASLMKAFAKKNLKENDWIKVLSQDGQQWFIKSTIVSNEGGIIKIWIKEELPKKALTKSGKTINYSNVKMLMLAEFDCTSKMSKFNSTVYYDSKGNVLQRSTNETDWEDITPETIQELLFTKVCDRFN